MDRKFSVIAAAGALALSAVAGLSAATAATEPDAFGLAGNGTKLVGFELDRPAFTTGGRVITGLQDDTALIGIDYRVQDRKLYGVGNQGGIYTLNPRKATAVLQERPRVTLDGSSAYGVDFNPAANALRIVSSQGTNLRVPFATAAAAIVDGPLTRPAVAPATGTVPATGVTAAAYTNNDLNDASATTLFVIDTERDQIAIQSPANAGSTVPTGGFGTNATGDLGFDIFTDLEDGTPRSNMGYSVTNGALYKVNLLTGTVRFAGTIGTNRVTDIAIALD